MPATNASAAYGTLLKRGDGGTPETYTAIAEITNIDGPNFDMEMIDATHMLSPDGYREFLASFKDAGEFVVAMNFVPASTEQDPSTGILSDFEARTLRNWELIFSDPSSTTAHFGAYVKSFAVTAPVDGKLGATMTLRPTGSFVWI